MGHWGGVKLIYRPSPFRTNALTHSLQALVIEISLNEYEENKFFCIFLKLEKCPPIPSLSSYSSSSTVVASTLLTPMQPIHVKEPMQCQASHLESYRSVDLQHTHPPLHLTPPHPPPPAQRRFEG